LQAALSGKSLGQYAADQWSDPTGKVAARGENLAQNYLLGSLIGGTSSSAAIAARAEYAQHGGKWNASMMNGQAADDILKQNNMDPQVLQDRLKAAGAPASVYNSPEASMRYAIAFEGGKTNIQKAQADEEHTQTVTTAATARAAAASRRATAAKAKANATEAFDTRTGTQMDLLRLNFGGDMSKWPAKYQGLVHEYEHYNPDLPASVTGRRPPHPSDAPQRTSEAGRNDHRTGADRRSSGASSAGSQNHVKVTILPAASLSKLLKFVAEQLPTSSAQVMGNPQSPVVF
jgi:hypothetical protein